MKPHENLKSKGVCCENTAVYLFCFITIVITKLFYSTDSVLISELKVNDTRYSLAANDNDVPDTKLIISKVDSNDRGNYTCNVTTYTGSFEVFTFVRVKGKKLL